MVISEAPVEEWVDRVRAEYLEMPGLTLTQSQMRRLWRLDPSLCDAVVDALIAAGFLRRRPNDTYARVSNDK
jgi:DNA-binding MarR family transcriptional regulator